jgi:hypothetical protein
VLALTFYRDGEPCRCRVAGLVGGGAGHVRATDLEAAARGGSARDGDRPRRRVRELAGRALGGFGERLRAGLSPWWPLASAAAGQDVEDQKRNDDDRRGDSNDRDCGGGYEHKGGCCLIVRAENSAASPCGDNDGSAKESTRGGRGDWPQTPPPPRRRDRRYRGLQGWASLERVKACGGRCGGRDVSARRAPGSPFAAALSRRSRASSDAQAIRFAREPYWGARTLHSLGKFGPSRDGHILWVAGLRSIRLVFKRRKRRCGQHGKLAPRWPRGYGNRGRETPRRICGSPANSSDRRLEAGGHGTTTVSDC